MNGKYFKYALGEIILVIVGILIALAIAEWNNNRHEKIRESEQLAQIRTGLVKDVRALDSLSKIVDEAISQISLLDKLLKAPRTEPDSFYDTLFGKVYGIRKSDLNKAYYESLKTSGFDLIKNEVLRAQMIQTFELDYNELSNINSGEEGINNMVNRPYYLPNFHRMVFHYSAVPNDINKIWNDRYYHNIVNYRLVNLQVNQKKMYKKTKIDITKLIAMIDEYLK